MAEVILENVLERVSHRPIFSLKEMTLFKIVTILCNDQSLMDLITKCEFEKIHCTRNGEKFKDVENRATELILEMSAIGIYKEMILDLLWPVTYRIILWKFLYAPTLNNEFLRHIYWTDRGRIDNKRTAKYIIANERILITKRFELACILCLTEEISKLWGRMEHEVQRDLLMEHDPNNSPLTRFWINELRGLSYVSEDDLDKLLEYAIEIGSIEAIKYFFSVMPGYMKNDKAILCFDGIYEKISTLLFLEEEESDIGYFIMSQMTIANQETLFSSYFLEVASLLLYSSEQNEFLEAWNDGLSFASEDDMEIVFQLIFNKYHLEIFRDHDYSMLFVSAWRKLPASVKDYLRSNSNLGIFFCVLLKDDFKFILENETSTNIANLIALHLKPSTCTIRFRIKQDKWNFLHFLIEEEIVTISTLKNKRDLIAHILPKETEFLACISLIIFVCDNKKKKKQK